MKSIAPSEPVAASIEVIFSPVLSESRLPARGLLGSLFVHLLFAALYLYLPWSYWIPPGARLVTTETMLRQQEVLLLPDLRPASSSGSGNTHKELSSKQAGSSTTAAAAIKGLVYKGEQLIVSNPPHPDNFVQTIRQPDLPSPPKLPRPLPFPAMISMAPAISLPAPTMPQLPMVTDRHIQALRPPDVVTIHAPEQQAQVESPKLPIPAMQSSPAKPTDNAVAKVAAPAAAPQHANSPGAGGSDARNIIVVDAVEVPARTVLPIPPGELYGAFTVSPGPFTSPVASGPKGAGGSTTTGSLSPGEGAASGSATGNGTGTPGMHGGAGTGAGDGAASDATIAGGGHGTGVGTGAGSGRGPGNAAGNGHGTGAANGNSPFPDLVIQGGGSSSGVARDNVHAQGVSPRQTSYGITIVANGASGGGFKDFGVFRNEASYTVYLDMSDAGISGSNWTMQYALDSRPAPSTMALRSHSLLVPPFANSKVLPHFSSAAAMRSRGSMIVVFGVINSRGNFEGLRVMQSPDVNLGTLLLEALSQWTFRPAEVEGTAVPVRILLGVPVNSVPQEASAAPK